MNERTTLVVEPHQRRGLLSFIDVVAFMKEKNFFLGPLKGKLSKEILEENRATLENHPELETVICNAGDLEWHVRNATSPNRIIFDFYFSKRGSTCFIILSNGTLVYTSEEFKKFFPE